MQWVTFFFFFALSYIAHDGYRIYSVPIFKVSSYYLYFLSMQV